MAHCPWSAGPGHIVQRSEDIASSGAGRRKRICVCSQTTSEMVSLTRLDVNVIGVRFSVLRYIPRPSQTFPVGPISVTHEV